MSDEQDYSTLLPHEELIVLKYLEAGGALDQGEAYRKVFPSARPARHRKFFARPDVKKYMDDFMAEAREHIQTVTLPRTLQELACVAFSSIKDVDLINQIDRQGRMSDNIISRQTDSAARAIQSIKIRGEKGTEKTWIAELKMIPKTPALEMLMKYFGGFDEDNKQRVASPVDNILKHVAQHGLPQPQDKLPTVINQPVADNVEHEQQ